MAGLGDLQPRKPRQRTSWAAKFCDSVEKGIVWFFDDYNSKKPNYWLKNNYASVDETDPSSNLSVVGTIPECLNGEFVRVGSNPKFAPVAAYHWFDGDGYVIRLHNSWLVLNHGLERTTLTCPQSI